MRGMVMQEEKKRKLFKKKSACCDMKIVPRIQVVEASKEEKDRGRREE